MTMLDSGTLQQFWYDNDARDVLINIQKMDVKN